MLFLLLTSQECAGDSQKAHYTPTACEAVNGKRGISVHVSAPVKLTP